jgi:predicted nucleotidyltransferase component of viral defense system
MNGAIEAMRKRYSPDYDHASAVKEIIQEIALLGLWRAKFFEHACFYGGTALRLLYGLDRFSEDLDFSLLRPSTSFKLVHYHQAICDELESFGLKVRITQKEKKVDTVVQSAFIKADSPQFDVTVVAGPMRSLRSMVYKIKFEIDTQPPGNFKTEVRYLLQPVEFFVKTMSKEDLFAGKMHAVLCRGWKNRVKGRDWFDMVWFCKNQIPLHLGHLEARLKQSGFMGKSESLTQSRFRQLLTDRIAELDVDMARKDILPFIKDTQRLDVWSKSFFLSVIETIKLI